MTTIRILRALFGITQLDLAARASISPRTLQRIEEGTLCEPEMLCLLDKCIRRILKERLASWETA